MRSKVLALVLALSCSAPALAGITHVGTDSHNSGTASTFAVTATTPADGDVLLTEILLQSTPVTSIPSGWTCHSDTGGLDICYLQWHTGNATSWNFGAGSSVNYCWSLNRWQGVDPANPVVGWIPTVNNSGSVPLTLSWSNPAPEGGLPIYYGFNAGSASAVGNVGLATGWNPAFFQNTCPVYTNSGHTTSTRVAYDGGEVSVGGNVTVSASQTSSFYLMGVILGDSAIPAGSALDESFMGIWLRARFEQLLERGY